MALAAHPKLLLLDEPLSGMNSGEVAATMELINKIWRKGTTILADRAQYESGHGVLPEDRGAQLRGENR